MQVFVLVPACANVTEGNSITPRTCIVFSISSRYKEFIPFEANTESGKTITRYPLSFSNPIHLSSISNSELTLPSAIFNFCKIGYFSKLSNPISCSAPKGGFVNITSARELYLSMLLSPVILFPIFIFEILDPKSNALILDNLTIRSTLSCPTIPFVRNLEIKEDAYCL